MNLITIVHHAEEDPIEEAVVVLNGAGVEFFCLPGAHDRDSGRLKERNTSANGVAVHHFQVGLPNPPSNQAKALALLTQLQLKFADEAISSARRLIAMMSVSDY